MKVPLSLWMLLGMTTIIVFIVGAMLLKKPRVSAKHVHWGVLRQRLIDSQGVVGNTSIIKKL